MKRMQTYLVTITESYTRLVHINAVNKAEACDLASRERYIGGRVKTGVKYKAICVGAVSKKRRV